MFFEAALDEEELESPTSIDLKLLLDPYVSKTSIVEPDAIDAESLASSDGDFDDNLRDIEYFRFKRCGLSIQVNLKNKSLNESKIHISDNLNPKVEEGGNLVYPILINFEQECSKKYVEPVGLRIERYDLNALHALYEFEDNPDSNSNFEVKEEAEIEAVDTRMMKPEMPDRNCSVVCESKSLLIPYHSNPSDLNNLSEHTAEQTTLTEDDNKCDQPNIVKDELMTVDTAAENQMDSTLVSNSTSASAGIAISSTATTANSQPQRNNCKFGGQQDRLSCVINDILARLNRQGILADPRDVFRKGGGRSGNYYEMDNDFFDDSLAYENLGVSAVSYSKPNNRSSNSNNMDLTSLEESEFMDSSLAANSTNQGNHQTTNNNVGQPVFNNNEVKEFIYDYNDPLIFKFDNNQLKDDEILIKYDDSSTQDEKDAEDAEYDSDYDSVDTKSSDANLNYISKQYFVDRRAWHKYQNQLPPECIYIFKSLETSLKDKGNKKGLLVPKEDVLQLFYDCILKIFHTAYPSISWDVHSFVDKYSAAIKNNAAASLESEPKISQSMEELEDTTQTTGELCSKKMQGSEETDSEKPMIFSVKTISEESQLEKEDTVLKKPVVRKRPTIQVLLATVNDLVSLHWPHLLTVLNCLADMCTLIQPQHVKKLWLSRLVLHNQTIYTCLEESLFDAVIKKSPLFRTKSAIFFRNLRKTLDAFLKRNPKRSSKDSKNGSGKESKDTKDNKDVKSADNPTAAGSSDQAPPAEVSPFSPVAIELLNWAIVYNCRIHELAELQKTFSCWSKPFHIYVTNYINECIERKRVNEAVNKKTRLWIPFKFMEETLELLRSAQDQTYLYEKRPKKCEIPIFIQPCKALYPPSNLSKTKKQIVKKQSEETNENTSGVEVENVLDKKKRKSKLLAKAGSVTAPAIGDVKSSPEHKKRKVYEPKKPKPTLLTNYFQPLSFESETSIDQIRSLNHEEYLDSIKDEANNPLKIGDQLASKAAPLEAGPLAIQQPKPSNVQLLTPQTMTPNQPSGGFMMQASTPQTGNSAAGFPPNSMIPQWKHSPLMSPLRPMWIDCSTLQQNHFCKIPLFNSLPTTPPVLWCPPPPPHHGTPPFITSTPPTHQFPPSNAKSLSPSTLTMGQPLNINSQAFFHNSDK